jgi:mRNA interferase RelE/StbE
MLMTYKVQFAPRAERHLSRLPIGVQENLVRRAEDLAANPRPTGARKLTGYENRWRVRVGNYRIIYEIRDDILIVLVVAVGHRREVYRGMA